MRSLGPRKGQSHPEKRHRATILPKFLREHSGSCERWEDASGATLRQIGRNAGLGEAVLVSQDGAIPPRDPLGLQGPIPSSYTASVPTGLSNPESLP